MNSRTKTKDHAAHVFAPGDLFVSLCGNDNWTGRFPVPNADKTDGPLATVGCARDIIRERKAKAQSKWPLTVWIRGGRYFIDKPIVFLAQDSGPNLFRISGRRSGFRWIYPCNRLAGMPGQRECGLGRGYD